MTCPQNRRLGYYQRARIISLSCGAGYGDGDGGGGGSGTRVKRAAEYYAVPGQKIISRTKPNAAAAATAVVDQWRPRRIYLKREGVRGFGYINRDNYTRTPIDIARMHAIISKCIARAWSGESGLILKPQRQRLSR